MTQLSDKADVLTQTKQLISLNQLPAFKDRTEPNRTDNRSGPKARSCDHQTLPARCACQRLALHLRQGMDRVITLTPRARTWQVGGSVPPDRCSRWGAGLRYGHVTVSHVDAGMSHCTESLRGDCVDCLIYLLLLNEMSQCTRTSKTKQAKQTTPVEMNKLALCVNNTYLSDKLKHSRSAIYI